MTIPWKVFGVFVVGLLLIGYSIGRYIQPTKVVTKVQTVTQTVVQDHIHTVTVTVAKPDGSKVTTITQDNNSVVSKDTDTNSSTVTVYNKPQWKISGMAGANYNSLSTPIYGGQVERRVLGPVFIGIWGFNNKSAGLSAGLEF